jgi:hypothetical protein
MLKQEKSSQDQKENSLMKDVKKLFNLREKFVKEPIKDSLLLMKKVLIQFVLNSSLLKELSL